MSPTPVHCDTDTVAAARYFQVTPAAVRQWLRRGHIEHRGYDTAGRALVDLHDIRAYLTRRETSQALAA
ncbi:helix-turn-helix domain-containing protein [Streptomyces luteireticuli]|uniref:Helix-turn-helix domain-containing protein n=1 Tax=Streptomyces luteireticuli TaxID=173858 RepID=A0ABN0YZP4_9ACTN